MSRFTLITTISLCSLFFAGTLLASDPPPEYEQAIKLKGNPENGKKLYSVCIVCHGPEGWGTTSGRYPQIAGQLPTVIIKQLADFRAGNRDNPMMRPFTTNNILADAQAIADIAAYISKLPMTPYNGKGPGFEIEIGKQIYDKECADCHGKHGEGDTKDHIPLIQGQHFNYLIRQFEWIRSGQRRNADAKMVKQIKHFRSVQIPQIMDYVSQLRPPKEKLAQDGWTNPDFPNFHRGQFQRYLGK
jgi:cytochrome c553